MGSLWGFISAQPSLALHMEFLTSQEADFFDDFGVLKNKNPTN